jgi:hypothetical protein
VCAEYPGENAEEGIYEQFGEYVGSAQDCDLCPKKLPLVDGATEGLDELDDVDGPPAAVDLCLCLFTCTAEEGIGTENGTVSRSMPPPFPSPSSRSESESNRKNSFSSHVFCTLSFFIWSSFLVTITGNCPML